jgi:hypothetical protein
MSAIPSYIRLLREGDAGAGRSWLRMREGAGMPSSTAVGTAQSRVLADVRQNGCHLRELMEQAAAAGARVVHFPEVALSGCVKAQI